MEITQSSNEAEMKITRFLGGSKYLFIYSGGDIVSFWGLLYSLVNLDWTPIGCYFLPTANHKTVTEAEDAAQRTFMWLFSLETTGLASFDSACWSDTLSAKVTLWFSKGKEKIQGKWNGKTACFENH